MQAIVLLGLLKSFELLPPALDIPVLGTGASPRLLSALLIDVEMQAMTFQTFFQFIPVVLFFIPALGILGLIKYRDWKFYKAGRRNPLTSDLLRGPGETLRERLDEINSDILWNVTILFSMPTLLYSMYLTLQLNEKKPGIVVLVTYIVLGVGVSIRTLLGMYKSMNLRRQHALGLDAESATGQELNQLMREGFWVFHDCPADDFNIDHVVIGTSGVFAVETKGRSKPSRNDGSAEREVVYDGTQLEFPGWVERKPLVQAERQAKWLQEWLTKKVGEPVSVQPVLALPGWFIKRTKAGGIAVINGKNSTGFFLSGNNREPLTEQQVNRIVFAVDQQCRNVRPRAYRSDDEAG